MCRISTHDGTYVPVWVLGCGLSVLKDRLELLHVGLDLASDDDPQDGTCEPQWSGRLHIGFKGESRGVLDRFASVTAETAQRTGNELPPGKPARLVLDRSPLDDPRSRVLGTPHHRTDDREAIHNGTYARGIAAPEIRTNKRDVHLFW